MKTKRVLLLFVTLLCINISCKKDIDMVPDQLLSNSYVGTLTVRSFNSYPEWDKTASINVNIDKETGLVIFGNTTLTYSGETIIEDDSKIERSGSWTIYPTGILMGEKQIYVEVDAGVSVVNDVQKLYDKDDQGNWVLVIVTNLDSEPNSDLNFVLDDAVVSGSIISADAGSASLTWILKLDVALD